MTARHVFAVAVAGVLAVALVAGSLWSMARQGVCQGGGSSLASAPCVDGRQP